MNVVKYKPVGLSGPIVRVRVTQRKRKPPCAKRTYPTVREADAEMDRKGWMRANA